MGGLTKVINSSPDPVRRQQAEERKAFLDGVLKGSYSAGNTLVMGGLLDTSPKQTTSGWGLTVASGGGWTVAIPKQGGGLDALTEANTEHYKGQFPDIDLYQAALAWAQALNARGEADCPKYPRDEFEHWLRKYNRGGN